MFLSRYIADVVHEMFEVVVVCVADSFVCPYAAEVAVPHCATDASEPVLPYLVRQHVRDVEIVFCGTEIEVAADWRDIKFLHFDVTEHGFGYFLHYGGIAVCVLGEERPAPLVTRDVKHDQQRGYRHQQGSDAKNERSQLLKGN